MTVSGKLKAILVASVFAFSGTAAVAQNYATGESMSDRLSRLESALQDLQGVVYSVEGGSSYTADDPLAGYPIPEGTGNYSDDLSVRISQLERELQSLTGRIEQVMYTSEQNSRRLDTLTQILSGDPNIASTMPTQQAEPLEPGSFNEQYKNLSGGSAPVQAPAPVTGGPTSLSGAGAFSGTTIEPVAEAPAKADCSATMPGEVNGDFDYAFNALLNGDYATAECGFSTFLTRYPSDPRAPDAQFRLGEIYLATGANVEAAKAFLNHVKTWPNDSRAPESYLKLGTAYARLGKKEQACQIFTVMSSKYPNASLNVRQKLAVERGAAGC